MAKGEANYKLQLSLPIFYLFLQEQHLPTCYLGSRMELETDTKVE